MSRGHGKDNTAKYLAKHGSLSYQQALEWKRQNWEAIKTLKAQHEMSPLKDLALFLLREHIKHGKVKPKESKHGTSHQREG